MGFQRKPEALSPAEIKGINKTCCIGNPDMKQVSTSYAERQNLSMRMGMWRFTRHYQWLLKEHREPRSCAGYLFHALQFRAYPSDFALHPSHGGWRDQYAMVLGRYGQDAGKKGACEAGAI